ncbi:Cro/CI family transcriptional regulator [Klebsiella grimontii]|uniref:Cro/CI family transcriptional regulator n=1 Tax=Klebsiella grimontii TaxID=2058152 RepID=UPI001866B7BB|nr:Cro/CI family transcriptional regulator [Klebsiella grimontii]
MGVMTLREFTDRYGQSQAGAVLGTTQMAVSKALASGRNISIKISESGDVEAFEIRPFPSAKRTRKKLKQKLPDIFPHPVTEA